MMDRGGRLESGGARWRAAALLVIAACGAACGGGPSDAELTAWRAETEAANQAAVAASTHKLADEPGHVLTISGQTRGGRFSLDWAALGALATTHVVTTEPQDPTRKGVKIDFRGVLVRTLLAKVGAKPEATEVTFVAIDAFRAPVATADAQRFDMLLALEADGKPLPRDQGGPIFLVHPHSTQPETQTLYPDRFWCFYVTDMIVGTEAASLTIGDRTLDAAALDALPQHEWTGPVRYKSFWPGAPVLLRGVLLRDALAAAGAAIPPGGGVTVKGKAAIHHDPRDPRTIVGGAVASCDILLATRWAETTGAEPVLIPARLGGPIVLAIPSACADRLGDPYWITFVEELVVTGHRAAP
ncbi:MAG: molybdopterin-dependent oxidoreductase [Deltaproteobacteria bacterium]|nr:molybdopterin-dependent oxidoreductase [Deltaproteobacteria bacterium]